MVLSSTLDRLFGRGTDGASVCCCSGRDAIGGGEKESREDCAYIITILHDAIAIAEKRTDLREKQSIIDVAGENGVQGQTSPPILHVWYFLDTTLVHHKNEETFTAF